MSDIIQLLPDSVANQIAAGEVIQRPASVVKELVENAIDAGAKRIDVLIQDAGRTSIQVIDDGKGMSETDARLAFERHATSKIRQADDLFSLKTMGFRGEALASIAAVAQVELKTRQENEEVGTRLSVSGSRFSKPEPCACPVGSNFMVNNLFFNVPARRKFLKSNTTEMNNIIAAFERIVLVYPELSFTLSSNGVETFNLRPGNTRQRIVDVFGKRINQDLLPVKVETTMCRISGFVGKPESAKRKVPHQFFFVNGRYMRHPYFHKAVQQAYDRLVPEGEQTPYFIYFDVEPHDIDVNIHPTKTEIKFENEQAIWQILHAAVKESVGMYSNVTAIDFDTEGKPDIPIFDPTAEADIPSVKINPQYNPFKVNNRSESRGGSQWHPNAMGQQSVPDKWEKLYEGLKPAQPVEPTLFGNEIKSNDDLISDKSPAHYQYKGRYIMTAVKSGLMVIEQHRAHVRILYERYLKRLSEHKLDSQKLLFPEIVQLTPQEVNTLHEVADDFRDMGFELTDMAGGSYSIQAVPVNVEGINYANLIIDMLAQAAEKAGKMKEDVRKSMALSLARNAAIPVGQVLSNNEMENIVNSLFACEDVNHTPDGKKILGILRQQEIDMLFD
ncbi:MAG: DNA mismatch repair endonuclease MutL [Prevotella sp.]|jgi:DNA mismatch repair protein MutL